ncbi:MAG: hypothetical protein ACI87O_001578 [Planctomycetota bacterium]|jgi:hypothetical protein
MRTPLFLVQVLCLLPLFACQSLPSDAESTSQSAGPLTAPTLKDGLTEHIRSKAEPTGPQKVQDLNWLAGRWVGEGFGGLCEEIWSPTFNGEMVGTFRLINADGELNFYEFMTMKQEGDAVVLRLVHLSPELRPWEEPGETTDFHLIETSESTAWFGGLTLHRDGDRLAVYVAMSKQDGSVSEVDMQMTREDMGTE